MADLVKKLWEIDNLLANNMDASGAEKYNAYVTISKLIDDSKDILVAIKNDTYLMQESIDKIDLGMLRMYLKLLKMPNVNFEIVYEAYGLLHNAYNTMNMPAEYINLTD